MPPPHSHQVAEVYEDLNTLALRGTGPVELAQARVRGEVQAQSRSVLARLEDCTIAVGMILNYLVTWSGSQDVDQLAAPHTASEQHTRCRIHSRCTLQCSCWTNAVRCMLLYSC